MSLWCLNLSWQICFGSMTVTHRLEVIMPMLTVASSIMTIRDVASCVLVSMLCIRCLSSFRCLTIVLKVSV